MPLIGNGLKQSAKSVLIPLGLTAAASVTAAIIHEEIFGSGVTTLIISNEEINDTMKIDKSFEESDLLIKGVGEAITNKTKEQKGGLLGKLLDTSGASLLGNLVNGKGTIRAGQDF